MSRLNFSVSIPAMPRPVSSGRAGDAAAGTAGGRARLGDGAPPSMYSPRTRFRAFATFLDMPEHTLRVRLRPIGASSAARRRVRGARRPERPAQSARQGGAPEETLSLTCFLMEANMAGAAAESSSNAARAGAARA